MELRTDRYTLKDLIYGSKEKGLEPIKKTNPTKAQELGKYAQRLHRKLDDIVFIRKGIPIDPKDITIKEGERAAVRLITTPNLDRDGEILIPKGAMLDDFRQSPSVLYAHDYKGLPVGSDQWIKIVLQGILAKTVYAKHQFAEDVYQCVKDDHLRSNSVGFIPVDFYTMDSDKEGFRQCQDVLEKEYGISKDVSGKAKTIYSKWILLEHSDVPVASNAQSLNIAVSKGILNLQSERLKKDLEIEIVKDEKDKEIEVELEPMQMITHPVAKDPKTGKTISGEQEIEVEVDEESAEETEAIEKGATKIIKGIEGTDFDISKVKKIKSLDEIITKPETTDNYHRIPVESPDKHKGHRIRTIVISAAKGIKALYCGECKKVIAYLFDVNKWSMSEAQTWVSEHKKEIEEYPQNYLTRKVPEKEEYKEMIESMSFIRLVPSVEEADKELFKETEAKKPQYKERWNKSLSKLFDVAGTQSPKPLRFHYELYEKFLECKVKEIFQNGYSIPGPLLGTYLAGLKKVLGEFDLKDTRKFIWDGSEVPPDYEVIQLNSEKSDDFLIDGMCFYEAEKKPLIVNFSPNWYGLTITLTSSNENKEWNKELLDKVHSWVYENNFLRGEKFSLSGDFLHEPDDSWDNLILDEGYKDSIRKSANFLEKKGKGFTGRGLLFIGPPGTGKTKTGRVLMNELDATFIWVSSKDFRHIGPLRALALGFSLARDLAPSVLFLEDIDTWLRGEMEFVTDLIKTEMDGIKQNRGIITILTSNYPEKLPDALLDRPGRFHHIVNFELPKAEHREEMLKMWAGDIGEDLLKEITEKTDGFSGAHIRELVEFAKMIAEEDEVEIGKALIMSLDKLTEQRELIEEIRENKTDAKAMWGRVKLIGGEIEVSKKSEALREHTSNVLEVPKGNAIEGQQGGADIPKQFQELVNQIRDQVEGPYEKLLKEKDEHIIDLKEGRVLSRKNRKIVKDAVTALNAVLKADATGSREDEEEGEKEIGEIEVVETESKSAEQPDIGGAVKEALAKVDLKEVVKEAVEEDLDKKRGKVK